MISESLNLEIWDRLYQGKSLDDLNIKQKDGRMDLRGLALPDPMVIRRYQAPKASISEIEPSAVFQGIKWRNLDFTGSKFNSLRLFDCEIHGCQFEKCQLQDLRLWGTRISESSFKGANLKKSALGGVKDRKRNIYSDVDFSEADLRETVYKAAVFERCIFRNSKLVKIDFQTSTFTDCLFEGELRDILFYGRGFQGEAFPPNEMVNVDFSQAKLRQVGFRGLVLDRVKMPHDEEHIVIPSLPKALDRMIDDLRRRDDVTAKKLIAFLNIDRKWILPNQAQGVINIRDLAAVTGEEGVNLLRSVLPGQNTLLLRGSDYHKYLPF